MRTIARIAFALLCASILRLSGEGAQGALTGERFAVTKVAPKVFTPGESSSIINRVRFYFENPDNSEVTIRIFDFTGALVKMNLERENDTIMAWDGSDRDGKLVEGGIYIYQIEAGSKIINGAVIVSQ